MGDVMVCQRCRKQQTYLSGSTWYLRSYSRLALLVALQTQKNQDVDLDPTRMTQLP